MAQAQPRPDLEIWEPGNVGYKHLNILKIKIRVAQHVKVQISNPTTLT